MTTLKDTARALDRVYGSSVIFSAVVDRIDSAQMSDLEIELCQRLDALVLAVDVHLCALDATGGPIAPFRGGSEGNGGGEESEANAWGAAPMKAKRQPAPSSCQHARRGVPLPSSTHGA